ncbi:MAG: acetate uptake transporter [Solirubrobacteraceae bacterium]
MSTPTTARATGSTADPTIRANNAAAPPPVAKAPPVADPAALGLAAFGLTTFMLSMVNGKIVGAGVEPAVFGMALAMGGLAQLLAGMWEFRNGNTFGATAFTAYGAFWLSFWAFTQFYASTIPEAQAGHAVGLYLYAWAAFTFYMIIPSFATARTVNVVFLLLAPTFLLLAIGNYGAHPDIVKIGGWLGILTAIAAAYGSCAVVTNATFGRVVLPTGPLARTPQT